jgi:hypothetical protein
LINLPTRCLIIIVYLVCQYYTQKPTRMRVKNECANDTFACEFHTPACQFLNIFLLRHAQFFRTHDRVWFSHAWVWFWHARVWFPHAWVWFWHARVWFSLSCVWFSHSCVWFSHSCTNLSFKLQINGDIRKNRNTTKISYARVWFRHFQT